MIDSLIQFFKSADFISIFLLITAVLPIFIFFINTSINAKFGPFLSPTDIPSHFPLVSVLVPARDEAGNIEHLINSLIRQDYPNLEILILDDNSTDNTARIVKKYEENNKQLKLISGKKLPEPWLGKNWACHQLSEAAKGDILIFTDADNWHEPFAVRATVATMQKFSADVLSMFPQQYTFTFWEKLIVPMIDLIVYSGIILWLIYHSKSRVFAAAIGQWIAFDRKFYDHIGGHAAVKSDIVEDVSLARLTKSSGGKLLTGSGRGALYCRMYKDFPEVWSGFSKFLYGVAGFSPIILFPVLAIMYLGMILPYVMIFTGYYRFIFLVVVFLNTMWRFRLAIAFRHNVFYSVFLHPLAIFVLAMAAINSFRNHYFGEYKWKGRSYKTSSR